jgi:phosphoenolpyruvate synthase/pyruvate phosphate dikinase
VRDAIAWLDAIDPQRAIRACGAKMGRLAELLSAGVRVPRGFAVTAGAYRRRCARLGLDDVIDAALGGLGADAGAAGIETAAQAVQAELTSREMDADLAGLITGAYEELSFRCLGINVPAAAVGVLELIHAQASGVAFSASPVTGKTDRVVIETNWGWGEAVVMGLVTPDHVEVGKTDGRTLRYRVANKKVISAFDYAAGRVVESDMPRRLADRRVLDDEQIAAVVGAVLAVERYYGYPVDVEWVLDKYRRAGEPVCIVQARPVTLTSAGTDPTPTTWDPAAMAAKYASKR